MGKSATKRKGPAKKAGSRAEQRRADILNSARNAFLRRRYSQVNVEDIAGEAGISKAAIYLYFSSKAHIYGNIVLSDIRELKCGMENAYDPASDVEENLFSMSQVYIEFFKTRREYFVSQSIFFLPGREQRLPPEIAKEVNDEFAAAMAVIDRTLREAAAKRQIILLNSRIATAALWSMWLGAHYLAAVHPSNRHISSLEAVIASGTKTFVTGLRKS